VARPTQANPFGTLMMHHRNRKVHEQGVGLCLDFYEQKQIKLYLSEKNRLERSRNRLIDIIIAAVRVLQ